MSRLQVAKERGMQGFRQFAISGLAAGYLSNMGNLILIGWDVFAGDPERPGFPY